MRPMRRALPSLILLLAACEHAAPPPSRAADLSSVRDLAAARELAPVPAAPASTFVPSDIPRIDVHTHIEPGALPRAIALLGAHRIVHIVNLSGGSPGGDGLEDALAEAKAVGS